ncbi:hypothetical protein IQ224_13115 [Microcystis sp. LEGE 00066]|uniref:hypothetical protein n=1 Tax=Microcystis sp. LEGE 00066 TaxID=1828685 RepID=UPI0018801286|nr:hypothetical protein [Microcystis sp. LEGE 00066]MBE9263077.1 hypothetical protein [Microcystis sp. LEGE 00066]
MATVQFSLTAAQVEILQRLGNPGESLNLTAKRVLSSILVRGNTLSNIDNVEPDSTLPTLDTDLTSTEWQLRLLDDRIKAIEIGIEADHYPDQEEYRSQTIAELEERIEKLEADKRDQDNRFGIRYESLEERIEKLEAEIEILTTLQKQQTTHNNGELVIFLADSEGKPIQFWSGQVWVDDLDLAYRYKAQQALARAMDKLKKRKLPGNGSPGTAIAFAPIENLLENGKS